MTGSGTAADPYIISDVDDLQAMENHLDSYYELGGDIDASATVGWNGGIGFIPVGTYGDRFTGSLDGKGYAITGLFINDVAVQGGLFGYIGVGAEVKNVGLEDCDITCDDAAALASYNYGAVSDCYSTGSIAAPANYEDAGGLIRTNEEEGTITDCYSACSVAANDDAGGLCERNYGTITRCYATGDINGGHLGGGLVCANHPTGVIEKCFATGYVLGTDWDSECAGLAVTNHGRITDCYARGDVTAERNAEGLVGFNMPGGVIEKSYATSLVTGAVAIAGLVRDNREGATVTNSFWDTETSGTEVSDGGTGKTTAQMKTESTFTDADWDFTTPIWYINPTINDGYPAFIGVVARIKGNPNIDQLIYQHVERMG
ncbi:hypothetical protein ES703_26587 [subsurface metagenome]